MMERNDVLSASLYPPTFFSTFGLSILLICVNTYIGVWFVGKWLKTEEEELMAGSKYLVIYKTASKYKNNSFDNENTSKEKVN
jgi:hypothetical protein